MIIKTVSDITSLNDLIPTLLVFRAYPRMIEESAPSLLIIQRVKAIHKTIKEIQQLNTIRQVKDELAMRNNPNTNSILNLPIQSNVQV